ncbi:MAG: hypothetical protein A2513_11205 [Sulfurimonas sp. RIFOXYD12_FULL_33_39]|uniref:hypothetical protein n=1 Tax=unclassified Sulfurimonas TaxID=2623549 RepID=UPI0008D0151F|nr:MULTISPECIES: hypothetical protein [unclassified Sulfurimonas]OHE05390.1 MAG: hypothetical protein A3G74_08020 [Sulfurimonas sp. RIFCSPLOWO2_12_FULL_34_6]OHE09864.1 MAG: hypothetical protein A2513_11205 [Sulfurimonas sp. RIFOXYD12_FULL_33_39]OHE13628.1 MAG: hypothetical protein A2530_08550 [Sulfurimonas sp. RIFOXYD2_FULL_34_21]DAB27357.1 MAG TPA: hypothetical protein CFH78_08225 [Sulfurimonas sp. UBA10385]
MSLTIILIVAVLLSIGFHFIGVYAGAKKTVWIMLVLMWAGTINIAMSEIKPDGYEDIKKMRGQFSDTDKLIEEAMPTVSLYEMLSIKKSYQTNSPKK